MLTIYSSEMRKISSIYTGEDHAPEEDGRRISPGLGGDGGRFVLDLPRGTASREILGSLTTQHG